MTVNITSILEIDRPGAIFTAMFQKRLLVRGKNYTTTTRRQLYIIILSADFHRLMPNSLKTTTEQFTATGEPGFIIIRVMQLAFSTTKQWMP